MGLKSELLFVCMRGGNGFSEMDYCNCQFIVSAIVIIHWNFQSDV